MMGVPGMPETVWDAPLKRNWVKTRYWRGLHNWYYVYLLIDPRDGKPFYVGKGTGLRMYAHDDEADLGTLTAKCERIREIWKAGQGVQRRIVGLHQRNIDACGHETDLIDEIGRSNLLNVGQQGNGKSKRLAVPSLRPHIEPDPRL